MKTIVVEWGDLKMFESRTKIISCILLGLLLLLPIISINHISKIQQKAIQINREFKRELSETNTGPTMEYYPRKYISFNTLLLYQTIQFPVHVEATDSDGVDTIIMLYRYDWASSWNQSILTKMNIENNLYNGTLYFKTNSSSTTYYDPVTIQVQYIANDTLNNIAESPILEFTFECAIVTSDGAAALRDTPDLWYLVNSTGHEITWSTQDETPVIHPFTIYRLIKDNLLLEQYTWDGELTINVDGLPLGNHIYDLTVACGAWPTNDNVTVHVVEELPTSITTSNQGSITDSTHNTSSTTNDTFVLSLQNVVLLSSALIIIVCFIFIIVKKFEDK